MIDGVAAAAQRPVVASSRLGGSRTRALVAAVVALALLPHVPGLDSDYGRSLLTQMAIAAVFALSFNLLFGQTGLLSFGHAVYFGLGGYAAIHMMRAINQGLALPMVVVPVAGAIGGLIAGIVFGALTTRKAGTIFALISLGVGELVYAATFMLPGLFGGEEGITASRTRAALDLGLPLRTQLAVYYAVAVWALLSAIAMYAFTRTPVGRMCNAVRDNPERAEFVGYSTQRVRFVVFAVAGLFAGLAGGLHAINYEIVAADAVSAGRSGTVLIMAYIGGAAHFIGPVLGAVVITWLQSSLSGYTSAWLLYLGLFFIAMILFAPSGLSGLVLRHAAIVRTRAFAGVLGAYALAIVPLAIVAAGMVLLVEMSYRLATQPELGSRMRLLWTTVDAATAWPWIAAVASLVGGFLLFRLTWRPIGAAWDRARAEAAAR
ncbi:MAG: branched-chain amino acid ABC transporter permease [Vicinamibacteria bacterium]|jgi:branched-chain amino acid transport system permease protein